MSKFTLMQNRDIHDKEEMLRGVEANLLQRMDPSSVGKGVKLADQLKMLSEKVKATQVQLNQLVSGGNTTIVVLPEQPVMIDVVSMSQTLIKVETKDHRGPLQLTVEFEPRKEGDLITSIHSIAKVTLENFIWQFKDKKKMILRPFKAFDSNLLTAKQSINDVDKNLWQPHDIHAQFFSQDGCTFKLTVNFTEEETMRENRKRMGGTSSIKLMRGKFYEQVEKRIENAVNKKAEIRKVNKEIADLKRQRRHRERAHKEKAD